MPRHGDAAATAPAPDVPCPGGLGDAACLAPEVLPAESLPQSLSVSSGLVPAASEHLRRHNEVV